MRRFMRKYGWSYAFVLPSMTTFTIFVLIPVLWAFIISFQDYSIVRGGKWADPIFENYVDAFTQQRGIFLIAIRNTLYYSFFPVIANIFLGLALASLIQPLANWLRTFYRSAYYLPAVTSAIVIGMTSTRLSLSGTGCRAWCRQISP